MTGTFTVISKPSCPYCDQAKALLETKGLTYEVINLDVGQPRVQGEQYISKAELLQRVPGLRTVPYITHDEIRIGGFTELQQYVQRLELRAA